MAKIAIIGAGHVGAHVAMAFSLRGLAGSVVLIDTDRKKAHGHAVDLNDMSAYAAEDTRIETGTYADISDADIAVVSACGAYFEENRLNELEGTRRIMDEVGAELMGCGFHGIVVSISNPCDLIAQYLSEKTGLCVIGTGTMLDSARLRVRLARRLGVASGEVRAYMLGEHGDSQIAAYSCASVGGAPLACLLSADALSEIERSVVTAGWDIVLEKGCTEFGIGQAAAELIGAILRDENRVLPCSAMLKGEYGPEFAGVYASVPRVVGAKGIIDTPVLSLSEEERRGLLKSVELLKGYL